MKNKIKKSDDEWRAELTPEQYEIMRKKGTEAPFTGKYWNEHRKGSYRCAACGQPLFESEAKFDSGTGWPSFSSPIGDEQLDTAEDTSCGRIRTEVLCSHCEAHIGHVFDDGPIPTGLRYCINSAAIDLEPEDESEGK